MRNNKKRVEGEGVGVNLAGLHGCSELLDCKCFCGTTGKNTGNRRRNKV